MKIIVSLRALPPYDHPHVFLDMGGDHEKVCPYCSTLYVLDSSLKPTESIPPGCLYEPVEPRSPIRASTQRNLLNGDERPIEP